MIIWSILCFLVAGFVTYLFRAEFIQLYMDLWYGQSEQKTRYELYIGTVNLGYASSYQKMSDRYTFPNVYFTQDVANSIIRENLNSLRDQNKDASWVNTLTNIPLKLRVKKGVNTNWYDIQILGINSQFICNNFIVNQDVQFKFIGE